MKKRTAVKKWLGDITIECTGYQRIYEKDEDGSFELTGTQFDISIEYKNWRTMWSNYMPPYGSAKLNFDSEDVIRIFNKLHNSSVDDHTLWWQFAIDGAPLVIEAEQMVLKAYKEYFVSLEWCEKHERWYKDDDTCYECEEMQVQLPLLDLTA